MTPRETLNVAVVGDGPGCKAIMDMIFDKKLRQLRMKLVGVAYTNPNAKGYRYAQEKGIFTTRDYRDLYKIEALNMIIEVTGRDEVVNDIFRTKPDHVRLIGNEAARLLWDISRIEEEKTAERKQEEAQLRESEQKYSKLVENSLTGIYINQDEKIVFANSTFAAIYGYSRQELLGMEGWKLVHPEDRALTDEMREKRLRGEEAPPDYEARGLRKDGSTIWIKRRNTRIEYRGQPAILGNVVDITERKLAEQAVIERDATLSAIVSSITDCMSMIDDKHNILWTNNVAKKLFGPDLLGKKCYRAYREYVEPCEDCVVSKSFADGKVHEYETVVVGQDGKPKTFWCTASVAACNGRGRPKLVVLVGRDISERKRAEEQLRERKEALKLQARSLEEVNTALKVLLRRRDEDKIELEEKVLANVKELILPYLETLQNTRLDATQMAYTSIIESLLSDIVSPFLRSLSSKYMGLTRREVQVAGFVKEGKPNKEIAELLNISVRAVEAHRENIRAKLGLKHQPVNLRSFLLSLK